MGVGVNIDYVCRAAQVLSGWARPRLFPNDKADMMALCAGDNYLCYLMEMMGGGGDGGRG